MNCEKCNYSGYDKGLEWVRLGTHGPYVCICTPCRSVWNERYLHSAFGRAMDVVHIRREAAIHRGDADTAIENIPAFERAIQGVIDAGKAWIADD